MMRRCKEFLTFYGTGEGDASPQELDAHAATCRSCGQARDTLSRIRQTFHSATAGKEALEERIHRGVMEQVRSGRAPKPLFPWRPLLVATSCSFLIVCLSVGAWVLMSPGEVDGPPVAQSPTLPPDARRPIDIELILPDRSDSQAFPNRVRFIVKGLGTIEEMGEIELDEPVLDTMEPLARPASFEGL